VLVFFVPDLQDAGNKFLTRLNTLYIKLEGENSHVIRLWDNLMTGTVLSINELFFKVMVELLGQLKNDNYHYCP
jgi:hypothetical protein